MSNAAAQSSQSNLVMPLRDGALLLPNSCAAEVVLAGLSSAMSSDVVLGTMPWRNSDIPVISFEGLTGQPLPADFQLRQAVVLQGIAAPDRLPHFAVALSGMPHLKKMREEDIKVVDEPEEGLPSAVYCRVLVDGETLQIPDWDVLEASILDTLFGEGSWSGAADAENDVEPDESSAPPVPDVEEMLVENDDIELEEFSDFGSEIELESESGAEPDSEYEDLAFEVLPDEVDSEEDDLSDEDEPPYFND